MFRAAPPAVPESALFSGRAELLKTQVKLETSVLNAEHDQERIAYQRLVKENARLEQRNETLERELRRARGGKTHMVRG